MVPRRFPFVLRMAAALFAHLRFPHERVLLDRTRLAYVHLQNLLTDAKRDRAARVFGYVAVWLLDELLMFYLQEGELVTATSTRDGRTFRTVALREAVRRVPTAAEYGDVCFHEADDEQLACMFAAQTSVPDAWPADLRTHDPAVVLPHLLAAMFDGVVELDHDGALHYVTFRHGLPRRIFAAGGPPPAATTDAVRALWPRGGVVHARRWPVPQPLPVQATPALIDVYRALVYDLTARLDRAGIRGARDLAERARAALVTAYPWLDHFAAADPRPRDPVTTAPQLTRGVAAWVTDILWAAALPDHLTPEAVLHDVTRERRHALQAAGFFEAVPWKTP